jgi:hypothetical protein
MSISLSEPAAIVINDYMSWLAMDRLAIVDDHPFHVWLFAFYPHIRVETVGDEPMVWFSHSRCNPPSSDDMELANSNVRYLNETAMACLSVRYQDQWDAMKPPMPEINT